MQSFAGKVALITGASSGIGRALAVRLAQMGASVGAASRNPQALDEVCREVEAAGGKALATPTDVTDAEQCRRAVEAVVERFGRLDILVCSAGLSMRDYFERSTVEAMERVMRVNFFGTLYTTHHALPYVKQTGGSLVAISSLTGKRGIPAYGIYGASKFAVQGLYESLRLELAPAGVHVGIVSPAFVDTPLRDKVLRGDGRPWPSPPPIPFRLWPLKGCVERIVRLILHRKREALIPWAARLALLADDLMGRWLGDRILMRRFPREEG